jgi:transposase-like protein
MVTLRKNQVKRKIRELRHFNESFKRDIVKQIEQNLTTVTQVAREYKVSRTTVYQWIYKYSKFLKKGYRYIVEPESDSKKIEYLRERLKEMERALGQKQLQIDFLEKLIELGSEEAGFDLKKKHGTGPYPGFGKTEKNTAGK